MSVNAPDEKATTAIKQATNDFLLSCKVAASSSMPAATAGTYQQAR